MNNMIMKTMNKRAFWTLSKGKKIGYIESVYKSGLLFSTDFITFRETSSDLSSGDVIKLSTSKFLIKNKELWLLDKIMHGKKPICIEYSLELYGSPLVGDFARPFYLNSIDILGVELINIRKNEISIEPLHEISLAY
jgi:hypothetical protein